MANPPTRSRRLRTDSESIDVLWHTDADGVLFESGLWKEMLTWRIPAYVLPSRRPYEPRISYAEMTQRFESQRTNPRFQRPNGEVNMNQLVTEGLLEMMNDGTLPVTPDVIAHIGRTIPLFPGVRQAITALAAQVHDQGNGMAKLAVVVNSCGWGGVLDAAFSDFLHKGPTPMSAHRGLDFRAAYGQRFRFDADGVDLVGHVYDNWDKGIALARDKQTLGVRNRHTVVTFDGETDLDMALAAARQMSLHPVDPFIEKRPLLMQVYQEGLPEAVGRKHGVYEHFRAKASEAEYMHIGPLDTNDGWLEGGSIRERLSQWISGMSLGQEAGQLAAQEMGRAGLIPGGLTSVAG